MTSWDSYWVNVGGRSSPGEIALRDRSAVANQHSGDALELVSSHTVTTGTSPALTATERRQVLNQERSPMRAVCPATRAHGWTSSPQSTRAAPASSPGTGGIQRVGSSAHPSRATSATRTSLMK